MSTTLGAEPAPFLTEQPHLTDVALRKSYLFWVSWYLPEVRLLPT